MASSSVPVTAIPFVHPIGDILFDMHQQRLFRGCREIPMRPKSLCVLKYLVEHRGQLVTKSELMDAVWPNISITENSLTQCLTEVRRALGSRWRSSIKTVARRGYLLQADYGGDVAPSIEDDAWHEPSLSAGQTNSDGKTQAEVVSRSRQPIPENQVNLYFELCKTTATISSLEATAFDRRVAERIFWIIYWGRMPVVADEVHIGSVLTEFACALQKRLHRPALHEIALRLAQNCSKALLQAPISAEAAPPNRASCGL